MKTNKFIFALFLSGIIFFTSECGKPSMTGGMSVKMTDQPGDFAQVNVDIQTVKMHYSDLRGKDNGWVTLHSQSGVYNLLDFRNGATLLLSSNSDLAPGKIDQVQLVLGQNNSLVKKDGVVLLVQSNFSNSSGVVVNVNGQIKSNKNEEVVLDFDAEKSVVNIGGIGLESFVLLPVISVKSVNEFNQ